MKDGNTQRGIAVDKVRRAAESVLAELPAHWQEFWPPHVPRISQELSWVFVRDGTVVDIGGGCGFHASILARLGMRAICVDNFKVRPLGHTDDCFYEHDLQAEKVASSLGVEFIHTDILDWEPSFAAETIDAAISFDNIEHLHRSPRNCYRQMVRCLKPGGLFLIGGPNAANILKRLRVLRGRNVFARLEDWYMHERFVGHVREPVVADLRYIAADLGLRVLGIRGRNWLGLMKVPQALQGPARLCSKILEFFPSLCSDIYVLAEKP